MTKDIASPKRLLSLDVFRGWTIVLMILVNSQGNLSPYLLLAHAPWNGCTLADLAFPWFLFIMGVSTVLSLKKKIQVSTRPALFGDILKRSLILFLLGMILNVMPAHINLDTIRVYGILQRIALCYLLSSVIYLNTSIKTQVLIFLGILLGYWCLMTQIPVPGWGLNQLTVEGSWVSYLDQKLFSSRHLLEKFYDPEGFLSTIPSLATTLLGVLTAPLLLSSWSNRKKCFLMGSWGILFLFLGWAWGASFPINKNLWTSSFVLWSGGLGLLVFSLIFFLIDVLGYKKWALPLKIFGVNSLFAFILHVSFIKIQFLFHLPLKGGGVGSPSKAWSEILFSAYSPQNASLLYSLVFLFLNFLVLLCLYRRKIWINL